MVFFWLARKDSVSPAGSVTPRLWHHTVVSFTTAPPSNTFLYWKKERLHKVASPFYGLPERIRTFDLQSRSLTRYPAVPRAEITKIIISYLRKNCNENSKKFQSKYIRWSKNAKNKERQRRGKKKFFGISEKIRKNFKKVLTKKRQSVIISFVIGASPSGKATDSDSVIT